MSVALVTGATGFVGAHLARRLVRDGWTVHVLVRPTSDVAAVAPLLDGATVHAQDGSVAALRGLLSATRPETVFHLASLFLAEHQPEQVDALIESNLRWGAALLEAMACSGVRRLVNTGTSWQHFEGAGYCPVNLYAATKQAFEDVLAYYVAAREVRAVTLKLFDTYGPHDRRRKLIRLLVEAARTGTPLGLSPGEQRIDLVHIDDVVEAFARAAVRVRELPAGTHEAYGVSSGSPLALRDLVARLEEAIGRPVPAQWGVRPYRAREVMSPCADLPTLPGWQPRVDLVDGLRRVYGADA